VVAGDVMQQVVDGLGTAGGHGMSAGGQVRPLQGGATVQRELETSLTRRLLETLGMKPIRGRKLIPS
jgi:hypothetical protein